MPSRNLAWVTPAFSAIGFDPNALGHDSWPFFFTGVLVDLPLVATDPLFCFSLFGATLETVAVMSTWAILSFPTFVGFRRFERSEDLILFTLAMSLNPRFVDFFAGAPPLFEYFLPSS